MPPGSGSGIVSAYAPALYASAHVRYRDTRRGLDHAEPLHVLVPFADGATPLDLTGKTVDAVMRWRGGSQTVTEPEVADDGANGAADDGAVLAQASPHAGR